MHVINLVVGDWSGDGHSKTSTYTFETNLTPQAVKQYYQFGATKEQHFVINTIAKDYEDTKLNEDHIRVLRELDYPVDSMEWATDNQNDDEPYITEEEFVDLYWHIVSRGNPVLCPIVYKRVDDINANINIGGYGFFY